VFYTRSTDNGRTWVLPRDITSGTYPAGYARNVLACGPGHGIAHSNGTLICPVWITRGEPGSKLHRPSDITTLYSKDRGGTWQIGEVLHSTEEIPNMSEHAPAQLPDGGVMLNIRNESPKQRRAVACSPNGYSDWTKPAHDDSLIDPVCFGSLLRYDESTLLFCNAASEHARENITLRFSFDDGATWPRDVTVDPGPAAYADIAAFGGAVYVLYETDPNIVLSKIEIGDTRNV